MMINDVSVSLLAVVPASTVEEFVSAFDSFNTDGKNPAFKNCLIDREFILPLTNENRKIILEFNIFNSDIEKTLINPSSSFNLEKLCKTTKAKNIIMHGLCLGNSALELVSFSNNQLNYEKYHGEKKQKNQEQM